LSDFERTLIYHINWRGCWLCVALGVCIVVVYGYVKMAGIMMVSMDVLLIPIC